MEKLNDFFEKSHLILVFIFLSLFSAVITYGMLNLLGNFGESQIPASRVFMGTYRDLALRLYWSKVRRLS